MKHPFVFLAFLLISSSLFGQTIDQEVSTNIISQLFLNEFEFNSEETERISKEEMAELVMGNEYVLPGVKEQAMAELYLNRESEAWRGAIARFEADCGEVEVFVTWIVVDNIEENTHTDYVEIRVYAPPSNSCREATVNALGPVLGARLSGRENIRMEPGSVCVNVAPYLEEDIRGCATVIFFVDEGQQLSNQYQCVADDDCDDIDDEYIGAVIIPN